MASTCSVPLGRLLRELALGWNRLSPQFVLSMSIQLCATDELMWLRTIVVFREGAGWEVDEFSEALADIQQHQQSLEEDDDIGSLVRTGGFLHV